MDNNNNLQIITNGDLNQYLEKSFKTMGQEMMKEILLVVSQKIKLETQESTQEAIEKFEDKYKPYMDKMENTTKNAQKAIECVGLRGKQSFDLVQQVKKYLGIKKIKDNEYDYRRIMGVFLSEVAIKYGKVFRRLEDVPMISDYSQLMDKICRKLCPKTIIQPCFWDEVVVSGENKSEE